MECQCPNHSAVIIVGLEGTLHRGAGGEQVNGGLTVALPLLLLGVSIGLQGSRVVAGVGWALCISIVW